MKKIKSIASLALALTLIVDPSFSYLAGSVRSDLKPVKKEEPRTCDPPEMKSEQKAEQAQAQTQEQAQAQEQTQAQTQAQTQSDPKDYAPILFKPEYQLPTEQKIEWKDQQCRHSMITYGADQANPNFGEYRLVRYSEQAVLDYSSYEPNAHMTRIELAYYWAKILRLNRDPNVKLPADIDPNSIYADWFQRIGKTGIVDFMIQDGKFDPNREITRADLLYSLGQYWRYDGYADMIQEYGDQVMGPAYNIDTKPYLTTNIDDYSGHWAYENLKMLSDTAWRMGLFDADIAFKKYIYTVKDIDGPLEGREAAIFFSLLTGRAAFVNEKPDGVNRPKVSKSGQELWLDEQFVLGPNHKAAVPDAFEDYAIVPRQARR